MINEAALRSILQNRQADEGSRSDASIDLRYGTEDETIQLLLERIRDPAEDSDIIATSAESLGVIWRNRGLREEDMPAELPPNAKREFEGGFRYGPR